MKSIKVHSFAYADKGDFNKGVIVIPDEPLLVGGEYRVNGFKYDLVATKENLIQPIIQTPSSLKFKENLTEIIFTGMQRFKKDNPERTILQEAQDLVYGDRQADYGTVKENFTSIAKLWSVVLGVEVTPEQVGLCMVQVKVSRQLFKPKRDNLVDGAGYFATIEKMEREND